MREKDVEKVVTEEVKHLGGRAYKWTSPGNAGVPDRIVIFPGRQPMFVELKTDKGTLSALQDVQIKRLLDLGQEVQVVYGASGLVRFFKSLGYPDVAARIEKKCGLSGR